MAPLTALYLGGTGIISSACVRQALADGFELTVLNRGQTTHRPLPADVEVVHADVRDPAAVDTALGDREFDVVVDFVAFTPEHVQADVDRFAGRTGQYVFISTAATYQSPPARLPLTEWTPQGNPFWQYARDKIACEQLLTRAHQADGFPVTIVRPGTTYDRTVLPLLGGWINMVGGWTNVERMRAGKPVVVHGDGTALFVLTHHTDFARGFTGLLANPLAIGEAVHITSDELLSWNQILRITAEAAGVAEPQIVTVTSQAIADRWPDYGPVLDFASHSVFFDNTKVKTLVPGFVATVSWAQGAREIVAWHDADPSRRTVDDEVDALIDQLAASVG